MAILAVAGGTGPVGRTIVDGLVQHGGHKLFVLSRTSRPTQNRVEYLAVNYSDIEGTAKILESNKIATVISAMGVVTAEISVSQVQLVKAADRSSTTKRFVVSAYDMLHKREHIEDSPLANERILGMPHWKTYMHPWVNMVNVEKKWAVIPGDGSARVNFIASQDMAKFIARLMDLDKWDKISSIIAETRSISEILEISEKARGAKFRVAYDDLEKLKSGKISFISDFPDIGLGEEESEKLFAILHYYAGTEQFLVPKENDIKPRFLDIVTKTAEEVIEGSWKGK
ncbi:nmra-like family protein [Colletotrichum kahawae]|uniref:Nmra-like family protein n=1 Tax=Colletotrichum kahawae TaxID=34407 RepID=A0AAE0D1B0_COLKA|nr:nmra-like family protein [Colletotrichum kahawae]